MVRAKFGPHSEKVDIYYGEWMGILVTRYVCLEMLSHCVSIERGSSKSMLKTVHDVMALLGFSSFDRLCLGNKQQIEVYNVANIILYTIAINILK
jgi:hypothetical protein